MSKPSRTRTGPRSGATTRRSTRQASEAAEEKLALFSLYNRDINTGSEKLRPEDMLFRDRPGSPQSAMEKARSWEKENWFIKLVNKGNVDFFNYGLRLLPEDNTKANRVKLADFLKKDPKTAREVLRYIRTVWREWVLNQNVVSFWREEKKAVPFLLLGEQCEYSDAMGIEVLQWKPDFKPNQLPKEDDAFQFSNVVEKAVMAGAGGRQSYQERYFSGRKITLDPENWDEHFEVLTTSYKGRGFSIPDVYSVFHALGQTEHMEVGEKMLGLASRRVMLLHKFGFELKGQNGGPNAAFQKDISIWKKPRADAVIKWLNGRFGFVETSANFDYNPQLHYVDPKLFDGRRWDTVISRLMWYGGPLAFMMMAKQPNPFLLNIYKTMAVAQREEVGPHLNFVLNQGVKLPLRVQLAWSNRCFYDPRLAWDMMSGLMKQGPLSLKTALEESDFNYDEELDQKRLEAALEKYLLPLLSQHGQQGGKPGAPAKKSAGSVKPTGSRQKSGR